MELTRCVLFDCDGTLVDTELLGNVALAEQLALAGIAETGASLTELFLHAARAMGVMPVDCVVVDDGAPPHATAFSDMGELADLLRG